MWKVTSLYTSHTITSSTDFRSMQCRTACRTIANRRSKASRCGCHSSGVTGSADSDSSISADSGFSPLCKLPANGNVFKVMSRRFNGTIECQLHTTSTGISVSFRVSYSIVGTAPLCSGHRGMRGRRICHDHIERRTYPCQTVWNVRQKPQLIHHLLPIPWMHGLTWTGRNDVGRCFRS